MTARASGEFWRREKKDSYVMYMHTHTFCCIDIDVYRCRCRCRSRHRRTYAHRDLPKIVQEFLVPNYLPKPWQSRQNFWRCLEDPGMITNQKKPLLTTPRIVANDSKNWSLLISATCHLTLAFPVFFFLYANSFSLKFFGKDFTTTGEISRWKPGAVGDCSNGIQVRRVGGWGFREWPGWVFAFHGGYSIHPGRKKENQLPSKASFFRLSCLSFRV